MIKEKIKFSRLISKSCKIFQSKDIIEARNYYRSSFNCLQGDIDF